MHMQEERRHSAFSGGCFYAAFYLSLGSIALVGYQTLVWLRQGAWVPHQMWLLLIWARWEQPPRIVWGQAQPALDRLWGLLGNCPISMFLGLLAMSIAFIGYLRDPSRAPPPRLRDAH
jgi:hypothetical protein